MNEKLMKAEHVVRQESEADYVHNERVGKLDLKTRIKLALASLGGTVDRL